ncbi:DUF6063 family protein [Methanocalculus sp.]|uniref:DUF6063 family protein n=1 Tax=Methanocalculus sp. TaxID=2004547 RepID=UPI0026255D92|nr:DUF6063 family protein [Methanocalculus sp.]MDG6250297.1 DUF6063 family protein [Methanocalculus sp.]
MSKTMHYSREKLGIALDMLKIMLETQSISRSDYPREFMRYDQEPEVREALDFLTEKLGLLICGYQDALYLCPEINNRAFQLSNTDIKINLGRGFKNPEMYTVFFVMHVIITEFYREAVNDTFRQKLPKDQLLETVDKKVKAMSELEDLDSISEKYQFNFKTIHDVWVSLPRTEFKDDSDEIKQRGTSSKVAMINATARFMMQHGLVEEHEDAIYLTGRCKAIIFEAYNRNEIQVGISNFIEGLASPEGSEDA